MPDLPPRAARVFLAFVALLPTACITQHLEHWVSSEVQVNPSGSIEYPKSAWVEIKNVAGLEDGAYRVGLDAKAMDADVQWRAEQIAKDGRGSASKIVGRMLYLGPQEFHWWGHTIWQRRPPTGDEVVRLDLDEHEVPLDPDHLRDSAKAGVGIVRADDDRIRLLLFAPASDSKGWTKFDEYALGTGTQSSLRIAGFFLALPVTSALDLVTLPFQGIGCCLNIPGRSR